MYLCEDNNWLHLAQVVVQCRADSNIYYYCWVIGEQFLDQLNVYHLLSKVCAWWNQSVNMEHLRFVILKLHYTVADPRVQFWTIIYDTLRGNCIVKAWYSSGTDNYMDNSVTIVSTDEHYLLDLSDVGFSIKPCLCVRFNISTEMWRTVLGTYGNIYDNLGHYAQQLQRNWAHSDTHFKCLTPNSVY
jgi:hypothetical protein